MTKNAGGNESAALVNAVLGNILGIFVSPALIWLFMLNDNLNVLNQPYNINDYLRALLNLSVTVLIPLIIGQIIHSIWTEKITWAKKKISFRGIK
jgi:sodium/bile acid cotransporter 7